MRSCRAKFNYGVTHQVKERLVDGIDEHVLAFARLCHRQCRLGRVLLEQRAEIGVCGRREFVRGVSGRSSCEHGRRCEERCHDAKLFGGDSRLVGFVLPCGHLARSGGHAGRRLGVRLLDKRRLGFHRHIILALLINQKRFTRLRGGAPNVPQLTQIDIDLDRLVRGVPRKPCHDLVIDDLGQIFGDLLLL